MMMTMIETSTSLCGISTAVDNRPAASVIDVNHDNQMVNGGFRSISVDRQ